MIHYKEHFLGKLNSTDLTNGALLAITDSDVATRAIAALEALMMRSIHLYGSVSTEEIRLDSTDQATDDIVTASSVTEIFTVTGDQTLKYPVGSEFYVRGSTGNDALYVVTVVSYGAPFTSITVADVPDGTNDGLIARVRQNVFRATTGSILWQGEMFLHANAVLMGHASGAGTFGLTVNGTIIAR